MRSHQWHPQLSVPHFHVHTPHMVWQHVEHPLRAGIATLVVLLAFAVGGIMVREAPGLWSAAQQGVEDIGMRAQPRDWRVPRQAVRLDHMYPAHARSPSVDHMYAKPRPRY